MRTKERNFDKQFIVIYGNHLGYAITLFAKDSKLGHIQLLFAKESSEVSDRNIVEAIDTFRTLPNKWTKYVYETTRNHLEEPPSDIYINPDCGVGGAIERHLRIETKTREFGGHMYWDLLSAFKGETLTFAADFKALVSERMGEVADETELCKHHLVSALMIATDNTLHPPREWGIAGMIADDDHSFSSMFSFI